MPTFFKRNRFYQLFQLTNRNNFKNPGHIVIEMYWALNDLNLKNENRYILCNFLDQNSDIFELTEDIYRTNNKKTLNQLFLMTYRKAKKKHLITVLYDEYVSSINAISQKKEFNKSL